MLVFQNNYNSKLKFKRFNRTLCVKPNLAIISILANKIFRHEVNGCDNLLGFQYRLTGLNVSTKQSLDSMFWYVGTGLNRLLVTDRINRNNARRCHIKDNIIIKSYNFHAYFCD